MGNILIRGLAVAAVVIALVLTPVAQSRVFDLTNLGDTIAKSIQLKKPEWRYESVTPMKGSENVILQQWISATQSVRVAIVPHKSVEDAAKAMRDTARDGGTLEALPDLADEAFSWGRGTVSFRRQHLTIHVSAVTTSDTLDLDETTKNLKEERSLCKEFARIVADAIKGS